MEVMDPRCCGLDVHTREVVACVVRTEADGTTHKAVRAFGTMTPDILALADWLTAQEVSHVAMESTGVSGKPIWNLLEESFSLLLVNARHVKAVPGRKTDVRDGEWLAELLRHGLLTGSFVPDRAQRERRELTRYRTSLVRERTAAANRRQKTLEGANITLASVAEQVVHIDFLDEAIARVSAEIAERVRPDDDAIARLDTIPGVGRSVAEVLMAEIGPDPSRFPRAQHLASWAGLCPGHHESGGKRRSGGTRKGSPWLRACLVQAAHAAARTKGTSLAAQYRRLAARRGRARTAVAVAHSILIIAYHLLTEETVYRELGANSFDERDRQAVERRLVHRLEGLGDTVSLTPAA